MSKRSWPPPQPAADLQPGERALYRDRLRAARYAALEDAEGFGEICFALEALGLRLYNRQGTMSDYFKPLSVLARSAQTDSLSLKFPEFFPSFEALYETVNRARNDAMHTGAYARYTTAAAIELCICLEDALMAMNENRTAGELMVKTPVKVEAWEPVARARQLMLTHSFSFLPVQLNGEWKLVSELGIAKYLQTNALNRADRMSKTIESANLDGMELVELDKAHVVLPKTKAKVLLAKSSVQASPLLWLVVDRHPEPGQPAEGEKASHLVGVLSPFELM